MDEFENRYLVDVKSKTHKDAIELGLSYLDGIVYNTIAYDMEHFEECHIEQLPAFLHITDEQLDSAIKSLTNKGLIGVENGYAYIRKYTLAELREDPLLKLMMDCFVKMTNLKVKLE